jgi:predicted DsbA family dithiol-disulfide isomerase
VAQEAAIKIDRRPYLVQPDGPPQGEPRPLRDGETETEVSPAWQERAQAAGLVMRRPQLSPSTILAHEATQYAREQGQDDEFHHAAAKAYWETGADLGDLAVLQELTQASGLDWAELAPRLESGYYRQRVLQEYQDAKDRGVGGTPTYMVGGELTFGDLSVEDLLGLVRRAASG